MVQNILQYKYDQIFDPENDPEDPEMKRKSVPIEKLIKSVGTDEQKVIDIYFSILSFSFKILNSDWIFLFSHLNSSFSRNFWLFRRKCICVDSSFFYLFTYQNLHTLLRNSRIEIWNWVNHVVKRSSQKLSNVFEINKCENILGIERRGKHFFGSIRHLTWNSCGFERA